MERGRMTLFHTPGTSKDSKPQQREGGMSSSLPKEGEHTKTSKAIDTDGGMASGNLWLQSS
eukprot:4913816-Prorocentrum_lima.AAC.1